MNITATALTTALVATAFAFATPAFATDGRTAVGMCINQTGCTYAVSKNGKNIDIIAADGTYIHCADAKSECTSPRIVQPPKSFGVTAEDANSFSMQR